MQSDSKPTLKRLAAEPERKGQIAGHAHTGAGYEHAVIYSDGEWMDLGTLGGERSLANSINDAGQVVGWSWMSESPSHAFLYEQGAMKDLGVPVGWRASLGKSINANGTVVAQCLESSGIFHAFLYDDGQWTDLNDLIDPALGWALEEPVAINDSGQVIGLGAHEGNTRAFLLTPIPEPSTFALLAVGAIGLLLFTLRPRKDLPWSLCLQGKGPPRRRWTDATERRIIRFVFVVMPLLYTGAADAASLDFAGQGDNLPLGYQHVRIGPDNLQTGPLQARPACFLTSIHWGSWSACHCLSNARPKSSEFGPDGQVVGYVNSFVHGQAKFRHQVEHTEPTRVLGRRVVAENDIVIGLGAPRIRCLA